MKRLKRIYVDEDFAKQIKIHAIQNDLPVSKLTNKLACKLKKLIDEK